jgi:hypothetical protein
VVGSTFFVVLVMFWLLMRRDQKRSETLQSELVARRRARREHARATAQ